MTRDVEMQTPRHHRTSGYTLLELLVVLTVLGIALSLAAPRLHRHATELRMRSTLDQLTADIAHARMLAVRSGGRVELRFSTDAATGCVGEYVVVVLSEPEREARRTAPASRAPGLCLRKNGPATVGINSRGRPGWNLSFWLRDGEMVDSMTVNQLGRVMRWP